MSNQDNVAQTITPEPNTDTQSQNGKPQDQENVFFSHRVVGGVPWAIVSKAVLFIVYFGISVLTVRILGAEKYGIFSICKNIADNLVVLCGLGLNTAIIRFVPELLVAKNRAGLIRFLGKAAALQAGAILIIGCVIWALKPTFDNWFNIDFGYLLLFTVLLVGMQVGKDFINDTFTALFQIRTVSIMTIIQSLIWVGFLGSILPIVPEIYIALLAQVVSVVGIFCVGGILLILFFRRLNWRSPELGIGKQRTLSISLSSLVNAMANMLMKKYTEVFFLGAFFSPAIVGMFDLGYSLPLLLITFVPLAVQKLFTSGFAEAYAQDADCLSKLISFFYKVLIVLVVPLAAFGAFFAPRAVTLFYGEEMATVGTIASIFFIVHMLHLVYVPLSMGIITKERILQTIPLTVMQIVVKLSLDYLLIPKYEINGAIAAVVGTFLITIPIHLYVVYKLLGGIYFPVTFFIKIAIPVTLLTALLSPLSTYVGIPGLCGLSLVYAGLYVFILKGFRLIDPQDLSELKQLGFGKLNRVLDFLGGKETSVS